MSSGRCLSGSGRRVLSSDEASCPVSGGACAGWVWHLLMIFFGKRVGCKCQFLTVAMISGKSLFKALKSHAFPANSCQGRNTRGTVLFSCLNNVLKKAIRHKESLRIAVAPANGCHSIIVRGSTPNPLRSGIINC